MYEALLLSSQKSRKDKNRSWHFYFIWYPNLDNSNECSGQPTSEKSNKILVSATQSKLTGEEGDGVEGLQFHGKEKKEGTKCIQS